MLNQLHIESEHQKANLSVHVAKKETMVTMYLPNLVLIECVGPKAGENAIHWA
jgi:hypothetical protein